jgi:predicted transcriptional regulator
MSTSIHLPRGLLQELDRRAKELKLSRNRLIVRILEEGLQRRTQWPPGFFERLEAGRAHGAAVDEMLQAIRASRRSKKPVRL